MKQGDVTATEVTLKLLRGPAYPVEQEIKELQHCILKEPKGSLTEKLKQFKTPEAYKPAAIVLSLMTFQVMSARVSPGFLLGPLSCKNRETERLEKLTIFGISDLFWQNQLKMA